MFSVPPRSHLRDDKLGESADGGDVVPTVAAALMSIDFAIRQGVDENMPLTTVCLRYVRSVFAAVAPALCPACGSINVYWLSGDARLPCAACGHRVVPSDNPIPQPVPSGTPSLPAADGQAGGASGEHGAPADIRGVG